MMFPDSEREKEILSWLLAWVKWDSDGRIADEPIYPHKFWHDSFDSVEHCDGCNPRHSFLLCQVCTPLDKPDFNLNYEGNRSTYVLTEDTEA